MTKEVMIELAKQSGWEYAHGESGFEPLWAFAKLIAEKERDRFIQICNHQADIATDHLDKNLLWQLRDAVKARGQA